MSDGKKSNDPGPGAPPPGIGFETTSAAGSESGVADDVVKKQVEEIKKSAMLRLTLAGSRSLPSRTAANGIPANMTPAQYAHQYRGGDQLPLATPDFFGGFTQPPGGGNQQFQPHYNQQSARPTWPPPPPPDYSHQLRVSEQPLRDHSYNYNQPAGNNYAALVNTPQRVRGDIGPHADYVRTSNSNAVNWRRVVHRDTDGEMVETVRWIREEVLM